MENHPLEIVGLETQIAPILEGLRSGNLYEELKKQMDPLMARKMTTFPILSAAKLIVTKDPIESPITVRFGVFEHRKGRQVHEPNPCHSQIYLDHRFESYHSQIFRSGKPVLGGSAVFLHFPGDLNEASSQGNVWVIGYSSDYGPIQKTVAEEVGRRVQILLSEEFSFPFKMSLGDQESSRWK